MTNEEIEQAFLDDQAEDQEPDRRAWDIIESEDVGVPLRGEF